MFRTLIASVLFMIMIKNLHQKTESKYILTTRITGIKGWMEPERQKIRIYQNGKLQIRTKGERFFPKITIREIASSEPGLYSFEETSKGVKTRTGTSGRYLPLLLEG